jgi:hypothetical protein
LSPETPIDPRAKLPAKHGPSYDPGEPLSGVVVRSDVNAGLAGAGQLGGAMHGHHGGHRGVDPPSESFRSLASWAPRASSRRTALPMWRASRESPEWVSCWLMTASSCARLVDSVRWAFACSCRSLALLLGDGAGIGTGDEAARRLLLDPCIGARNGFVAAVRLSDRPRRHGPPQRAGRARAWPT